MSIVEKNIYFIGIGGIGMSALARFFHQTGKQVSGYDRNISDLSIRLQAEGISVNHILEVDAIPFACKNVEDTLVVYTPAIAKDNPILKYFQENDFRCLKRAQVLGLLSRDTKTIAVAGTHGKTTVSSMIAFLLKEAGIKINAFLGGISHDFGTNLILDAEAEYMVTEADEYDRSFLQLFPNIAVVTSMDPDHLDIYKDEDAMIGTYQEFCRQIQERGTLFTKMELLPDLDIESDINLLLYGNHGKEIKVLNLEVQNGNYNFDLQLRNQLIKGLRCGLPGKHNVENASVAVAVAVELGVDANKVRKSLAKFSGVKRRFDVHLKSNSFVYIDDYAHHPQEIKSLLESVRELYPEKKITAVFQPHLYSRTKDFAKEFADVLAKTDELILLDLYPAREEPIQGIDSRWLAKKIEKENVHILQKNQLLTHLKEREIELLLTIGAGDIDTLVEPIIKHYE